jgi:antitoxin component of MazEF toxin-antitoxin module
MFQAKVIQVGGDSKGVVIPIQIANALEIKLGTIVNVEVKKVR